MKKTGSEGEKTTAGTTLFMAPELLNETDLSASKALDIWALGIMLYMMVFGFHPFKTKLKDQTVKNIWESKVKFPPHIPVTNELKDLIKRMLDKNPQRRINMFKVLNHKWFELTKKEIEQAADAPYTEGTDF